MSDANSNVDNLLSALKDSLLAEIPERCEFMEEHILALESDQTFTSAFNELFRAIHSLKGSGATVGLPIISSISHQFEDMLSVIDSEKSNLKENSIDVMLKYNDLLKSSALRLTNNNLDHEFVESELEKLKLLSNPAQYTCMFVEQSNLLSRVVCKELESLPVSVTVIKNGLVALERLLQEKFDFLITSKELPVLNGVALICALRKSESRNAKIPCIITTSKDKPLPLNDLDSIIVIKKDKQLTESLIENINAIIAK